MPETPARATEQMPESRGQIPETNADADELQDFDRRAEQMPEIPETDWRWEKSGSGNYKGKYYVWRKRSDPKRPTLKGAGGRLETARNLPARPGKGNRAKRQPRRLSASDAAIDAGDAAIRCDEVDGENDLA